MTELKMILDDDPECVDKYEIVHYRENGSLQFRYISISFTLYFSILLLVMFY